MEKLHWTKRKAEGESPRPPLISFKEIAKTVGLSVNQLRLVFANDETHPQHIADRNIHRYNTYYIKAEVEAWIKRYKEIKIKKEAWIKECTTALEQHEKDQTGY